MKPRSLLVVGLAVGYVLGARAGRDRYEQIVARAKSFWQNPRVAQARVDAEHFAREQAPVVRAAAKDAVVRSSAIAKDAAAKTVATARDTVDKTVSTAKGAVDKTVLTARDTVDKTVSTARTTATRTTTAARGAADRTVAAAAKTATRVGEARDQALANLDDLGDIDDHHE